MSRRSGSFDSMWAEASAVLDRAERLQRAFFRPGEPGRSSQWEPPIDLFESEDLLLALVALPGVRPQHVQVFFDGTDLVVAGERGLPPETAGLTLRRLEIPVGRFERRILLPPGRYDLVEHRFTDGCLTLALRRL